MRKWNISDSGEGKEKKLIVCRRKAASEQVSFTESVLTETKPEVASLPGTKNLKFSSSQGEHTQTLHPRNTIFTPDKNFLTSGFSLQ